MPSERVAASPLDKPVRDEQVQGGVPRVSLPLAVYFFNDLAHTLQAMPPKATTNVEWEARLSKLGATVGVRTLGLAVMNYPPTYKNPTRDTTTDEIVKFIATVMWKRWFDRPAGQHFPSNNDHYIEEEEPMLLPLRPDGSGDLHFGAFTAGMIKGVLDSCGFPAIVSALYVDEKRDVNRTQYLIHWAPVVIERERRVRQ